MEIASLTLLFTDKAGVDLLVSAKQVHQFALMATADKHSDISLSHCLQKNDLLK